MEDLTGIAEATVGGLSVAGVWIATQFKWWKNIESKWVRAGVGLAVFFALAITLSLLTSIFS